MNRNEHIYKMALADKKLKTALDANMAQAKLAGFEKEEQKEPTRPEFIRVSERKPGNLKVVGDEDAGE